ncbi:MAG: sulfotransferase [Phycisphaera sp.]|nr:sulfotransferase [Phycisphaera sp.]
MKCATTTLAVQLAAQDGVFISDPKEPNFFSNDEIYAKGTSWYESLFESAEGCSLVGEASTHYTKLPTYSQTIERFRAVLPDVKLIYVMRHPIDRVISQYMHEWSQRLVSGPIDDELAGNPWIVDYGRYAMQIRPWLDAFGPQRVLPVFNERLRVEPQAELERVCAFLGYTGTPAWVDEGDQNVSGERMRKSPLRDAVLNAPGLKQIRRGLVPKSLRDRAKGLWRMKDRPELSPAVRGMLETLYNEDLCELSSMLGLDEPLTCANFKSITAGQVMAFAPAGSMA